MKSEKEGVIKMGRKVNMGKCISERMTPKEIEELLEEETIDISGISDEELFKCETRDILDETRIYFLSGEERKYQMAMEIVKHRASLSEEDKRRFDFYIVTDRLKLIQEGLISEEEAENNLFFEYCLEQAIIPVPIAQIAKAEKVYWSARMRRLLKPKTKKAA
jgi:hypothetical protein